MHKISTEFLKTDRHQDTLKNPSKQGITEWEATLASLLALGNLWVGLTDLIHVYLLPKPQLELTVCEPAKSVSLVEHTNGRSALWSSSGYRTTFVFLFVSHWLKSKLKVKRLISCRNHYEECVLPGISIAILRFPCVKGVKCSFGSREDTWPLMTHLQTVQRLSSEQNWFILFSHVPARRYDQQVKYCCPQEIFFLNLLWNQSS